MLCGIMKKRVNFKPFFLQRLALAFCSGFFSGLKKEDGKNQGTVNSIVP
jgi:hypothetical protein